MRVATCLLTPLSCMVTPCRTSAITIVRFLCVMMMNCDVLRKSLITSASLAVLASSSAASTSSSRQNGLGLLRNMANNSATAVSVFSPPDNSEMLRSSFPGGLAVISIPVSRTSVGSSRTMSAMPPPKSLRNKSWKCTRTTLRVSLNNLRLSTLIFSMISNSDFAAPMRSS